MRCCGVKCIWIHCRHLLTSITCLLTVVISLSSSLIHGANDANNPYFFPIPLCVNRSSTYLFISVCFTGSEEPQQGENVKFNQHMVMLFIKMCDGIFLIRLFFYYVCQQPANSQGRSPHQHFHAEWTVITRKQDEEEEAAAPSTDASIESAAESSAAHFKSCQPTEEAAAFLFTVQFWCKRLLS